MSATYRAAGDLRGATVVLDCWDGDTVQLALVVPDDTRTMLAPWIRLTGAHRWVDAPERHDRGGSESREALAGYLTNADIVDVELTGDWSWDRQVAVIWTDGEDLAEVMITAGHATEYQH